MSVLKPKRGSILELQAGVQVVYRYQYENDRVTSPASLQTSAIYPPEAKANLNTIDCWCKDVVQMGGRIAPAICLPIKIELSSIQSNGNLSGAQMLAEIGSLQLSLTWDATTNLITRSAYDEFNICFADFFYYIAAEGHFLDFIYRLTGKNGS